MAKWGEGDPRWIVQNREDGRNVNNWHWTEIDFTKWAENRLTQLLKDLALDNNSITATTNDVAVKGEVTVNTRKQKIIFLYELELTVKFEGDIKGKTGNPIKGTITVPYISEENDDDDFEVQVSVEGSSKDHETMRMEVRSIIIPILKKKIPEMLQEMRAVASDSTKLAPKKQAEVASPSPSPSPSPISLKKTEPETPKQPKGFGAFTQTEKFRCGKRDLFECFIDINRVRAYAGGDCEMSREKGGKFKMFGGAVEGENVEVDYPNKLVQKWRFNTWPENHYSIVTITLEEKEGKTICKLEQTGVPLNDKERTERGWAENFWKRIKGIFGFGAIV